MASLSYGLIELIFVFGVVLGLGLWELLKIRTEIKRDHKSDKSKVRPDYDRD